MGVLPIHHVSISVSSLEKSLYFYRNLLKMKVTLEAEVSDHAHVKYLRLEPGTMGKAAMLQVGPPLGAIQLIEWSTKPRMKDPNRPGNTGVFLLAFELKNETIEEILCRLKEHEIHPWSAIVSSEIQNYGQIRTVIVEDPDGIMIEFLELPSRDLIKQHRIAVHDVEKNLSQA